MVSNLLLFLAVSSSCWNYPGILNEKACIESNPVKKFLSTLSEYHHSNVISLEELKPILVKDNLNPLVINKVLSTLQCANKYHLEYNPILTIIDYSLPSNKKRLWVYDLNTKKLLFNTYVSHGITSGSLETEFFSNKYNSKASSIGVYKTEKSYWGRDGLSLRLAGLDAGFNDNASGRAIVMHGGWYVAEDFIKKYGRAGRSWGCPAVPKKLSTPIINTIKNNSLFIVYYPTENWFAKSKFLNCKNFVYKPGKMDSNVKPFLPLENNREEVLLANIAKEQETVLAIPADVYEKVFSMKPPVERMLRRQINNREFIALSVTEFKNLANIFDSATNTINSTNTISATNTNTNTVYEEILSELCLIAPEIKNERGYYKTHMKIINLGKVKNIQAHPKINIENISETSVKNQNSIKNYIINFEQRSINLKAGNKFIRWLGL